MTQPAQPVQPQPQPQQGDMDDFSALVKMLKNGAMRQGDPAIYAELFLDTLGDEQAVQMASDPANMGILVQMYPDLQPFTHWLEIVRIRVLYLMGLHDGDGLDTVNGITNEGSTNAPNIAGTIVGDDAD